MPLTKSKLLGIFDFKNKNLKYKLFEPMHTL